MLLVVTGSPGTGKRSTGSVLSRKLGLECIEINRVAQENSLVNGSGEVDLRKLASLMKRMALKDAVVLGHLSPFVLAREVPSFVAVLRCSPHLLKARLEKRGYPREKVVENLWTEILDICLYDAIRRFGADKVGEFDTSKKSQEDVAEEIIGTLEGRPKRTAGLVRWLDLLESDKELFGFLSATAPSSLQQRQGEMKP